MRRFWATVYGEIQISLAYFGISVVSKTLLLLFQISILDAVLRYFYIFDAASATPQHPPLTETTQPIRVIVSYYYNADWPRRLVGM